MNGAPGFFGKLPSRGDFVGRGLSAATVAACDRWISQSLIGSRALLAEDWDQVWRVAPVWHFALPPGQCGPCAFTGLLYPSTDRVGRAFPLIAAAEAPPARAGVAANGEAYHRDLEAVCQDALARRLTPEDLAKSLAEIIMPDDASSPIGLWWTDGGAHVAAGLFQSDVLPDAAQFARMLRD